MSIWTELLFLHGHLTRPPGEAGTAGHPAPAMDREAVDRLRELIGCPPPNARRPEPRPLLGVRGLA